MVHEGHHYLFVILEMVLDEFIELSLPGLSFFVLFLLLQLQLLVLSSLLFDVLQGSELPLDVKHLLYSFLLFVLHVADAGLDCLSRKITTWMAF